MAIITRYYLFNGPTDQALAEFVGGAPVGSVAIARTIKDVTFDDAVVDPVDLDQYMAECGWVASVGAPDPVTGAPRIVVGNVLSGDTAGSCDVLDPGDGSGLESALLLAGGAVPAADVWVRPGVYDFSLGAVALPLTVPAGVTVRGAGMASVLLRGQAVSRQVLGAGASVRLERFTVELPAPTPGAIGGAVLVLGPGCDVEGLAIRFVPGLLADESLVAAVRMTDAGTRVCSVTVTGAPRLADAALVGRFAAFEALGPFPAALPLTSVFDTCSAEGGDVAVRVEACSVDVRGLRAISQTSDGVLLNAAVACKVGDCDLELLGAAGGALPVHGVRAVSAAGPAAVNSISGVRVRNGSAAPHPLDRAFFFDDSAASGVANNALMGSHADPGGVGWTTALEFLGAGATGNTAVGNTLGGGLLALSPGNVVASNVP